MQGKPLCYDLSTWVCDFTKNGYRLPTEAEWEKADRGGVAGLRFPWSGSDTIQHARANYSSSAVHPYDTSPTRDRHPVWGVGAMPYTSPVGFFNGELRRKTDFNWPGPEETYQTSDGANGYGLYDMAGNVQEWCNDWADDTYYSVSPYSNPRGPAGGTERIMRGGAWNAWSIYCRSSRRGKDSPDLLYYRCGVRLVVNSE